MDRGLGHRSSRRCGFTSAVSFLRGLLAGLLIAALQLAGGHASLEYQKYAFHGNSLLALAVPVVFLPLAIAWGWTWVSGRWSGRSGPRLLLFTLGLALSAAAAFPMDYALFPKNGEVAFGTLADVTIVGFLFVVPVVALAALLYWAFASGRVAASFGTLAIGYIGGLFLALLMPTLTMGAVAGTAAGHSWQRPEARFAISVLVVLLMLVGVFELRMAAAQALL